MTEVQELLAQALTDLPGGPITAPVGLGAKAQRRSRRRRQVVAAASVVGVLAIGAGATLALRPGPVSQQAVGRPVPGFCVGQPSLGRAPDGSRARHSARDAEGAFFSLSQLDRGAARGATTLLERDGQLVWSVELLEPAAGGLQRVLWLFPDETLSPALSVSCGLPPQLVGATVQVEPAHSLIYRSPPPTAVLAPVAPLTRDQASIPWTQGLTRDGGRGLDIGYGPGCHGSAQVQVEQTLTYVLIRVVREGPESGLACETYDSRMVELDAPLGRRLLLHAATREILPSKAYQRRPSYLPLGARSASDTTNHSLRTLVWALPGGRTLTFYVGIRSVFDRAPETTSAGPYAAQLGTVRGAADLAWEENGVPLQVRLSGGSRFDDTVLHLFADGLYTPEYVGLTVPRATAVASSYGLPVSTARSGLATGPRRITFTVVDGVVTAAAFA